MIYHMLYAVLYADLLMSLVNQVRPYEVREGESEELAEAWTNRLADELAAAQGTAGGGAPGRTSPPCSWISPAFPGGGKSASRWAWSGKFT